MKRDKAIIDGMNVAYLQAPREPRPNIGNVSAIAEAVEASGRDPVIVIDPSIRSVLADTDELDRLMSDSRVVTVPSGKEVSRFVLETANQLDGIIISNNTYAEYYEDYPFPWVEERRISVAMVNASVLLLDNRLKRAS